MLGRDVLRHLATHFVVRQPEIDMLEDRIATVRAGGTVFEAVLMFYGVGWIGKTTLVNELYRRAAGRGVPCSLIDFDKQKVNDAYEQPVAGHVRLLERMATDIASGVDLKPTTFNQEVNTFWDLRKRIPDDEARINHQVGLITDALLEYVKKLLDYMGRMPIVFFFDTIDQTPEVLDWLEGEIIWPLLRSGKVIFVVSGRFAKRWRIFDVRRRALQHELRPFTLQMTQDQLGVQKKEPGDELVASNLFQITFGHPGFNRVVVQRLVDQGQREIRPETLERSKGELVEDLVEELFERVVVSSVEREIQDALLWIAPLRRFDIGALREILAKFLPDQYGSKSPFFFLNLAGRMVDTTLVAWSKTRKGYAINDTVRKVLTLKMQLHSPSDYRAVNRLAVDWYQHLIGEGHFVLIVEKLYHLAKLYQAREAGPDRIGEELKVELERCLHDIQEKKETVINVMSEADLIRKELDEDHELKDIVGANFFDWLIDDITVFQKELS